MFRLLCISLFLIACGAQTLLYGDAGDPRDNVDIVQAIRAGAMKAQQMSLKPGEKVQLPEVKPKVSDRSDVFFKINGRVREDFFFFNKVAMLQGDLDDTYRYYRSKMEIRASGVAGMKTYGEPAATFGLQFSNYGSWNRNTTYQSIVETKTFSEGLERAATGDNHTHDTIVPLVYMEAGMVELHFGTISQFLKKAKQAVNLRAGYFPYSLGRGLSLGTHGDMCLTWGGWRGYGDNYRFPTMPPGVLLQHKFTENCSWEFYYNKWRAYSDSPFNQNIAGVDSGIFLSRLDGRRPARGHDQDRDTWVLRFDFNADHQKFGKLYVQPYFAYTRAPDQNIEFIVDAKSRLGTVGFMLDYRYKGWEGNIEVAGQFGHQRMHCIDRNVVQLKRDKTTGDVREVYSHIFLDGPSSALQTAFPNGTFPDNMPVRRIGANPNRGRSDGLDIVNLPANRPNGTLTSSKGCKVPCLSRDEILAFNGKQLVDANGAGVMVDFNDGAGIARNAYNSNFFGNARFRPSYKLKYQGVMALVDLAYTTDDKQFKFAAAGGYIGGDNFPYNKEVDQPFKAFIAQRAAYGGLHVLPTLMFERLVVCRPVGMEYRRFVGRNHFRDYSNLQFVGASFTWLPLKNDRPQLVVMPNVIAFWQVADVLKWDKNGKHPDPAKEAQIDLVRTRNIKFSGWETTCLASKFLGVEANLIIEYFVIPQCKMYFKGYLFFPGQCYKDLDGMPNEFGLREDKNRQITAFSQGHDIASGFYTGIDFKF